MALVSRGKYSYGDSQSDIRAEIARYSAEGYLAEHFADAVCTCGGTTFRLKVDENEGAAVRTCSSCRTEHPIGDSAEYLDDAELVEHICLCGHEELEITAGASLYEDSEDVRWFFLGCRCPECGLTGVYADWKNEFEGYQNLLARI